jgi:GNAT superfamily N-acetyltransferase
MAIKIRPATEDDIPQVHAIYSHYVRETVLTFMQTPPPLASMIAKFRTNTTVRGLPYLVAVDDKETTAAKVLGYTYLSPFRGTMLSYGPTVELSLFLDPAHRFRGLGTRLLSALLSMLGPYPYNNNDKEYSDSTRALSIDGVRHLVVEHEGYPDSVVIASAPVRNVIACMALDSEGKDGGEGLRRWYEERGFVERGRLKGVGFKKGRR